MAGMWRKTLVYLGLAEEEDYDDYAFDDLEAQEPEREVRERRPVRRAPESQGPSRGGAVVHAMPSSPSPKVHLVQPTAFNDAQEIGDKFKEGFSILMNLHSADPDLARRLVDFASGLAYGLSGSMQPVAERVFLITPSGVEVSAEERRRFLEERGFFNQA
jgi:cell division inhibitor SepF